MSLLRSLTFAFATALLLGGPIARAQSGPPPPVPPILDQNRYESFNLNSTTDSVQVNFPVFGDCTDIVVQLNGQPLTLNTQWTCSSQSGGSDLDILPLPITDMVVTFTPALTTGFLEIYGDWHPRDLVQPTAPGINRREFNQDVSTLIASMREFYRFEQVVPIGTGGTVAPGVPGYPAEYNPAGNNPGVALVQQPASWQAPTSSCVIPNTARTVVAPNLTAPLACTLPAAASFPPGVPLYVGDPYGIAGTYSVSLQANGTDTINGLSEVTALNYAYASQAYESDGVSRWFSVGSGGSGSAPSQVAYVQDFCATGLGCPNSFTPGTTQSFTLSSAPSSAANLSVYFDGVAQAANTWSLSGAVVSLDAVVPDDVQVVEFHWGNVPGQGQGVTSINSLFGSVTTSEQFTNSGQRLQFGDGLAHMWPSVGQVNSPTSPWNAVDPYGNPISCSGTETQCLQEFINATVKNGWTAEVDCQGTVTYSTQSGTLTNGSNIITGLSNTSVLQVGYYLTVRGGTGLPSFTQITSIDSSTQIHINNNATANGASSISFSTLPSSNLIDAAVGISVPPAETWHFEAKGGCNLSFASSVTGPGLSFDSLMAVQFIWNGVIVYQPSTQESNSYGILFAPTNPVPQDGIITLTASKVQITNPVANGNALCNVCMDAGGGPIIENLFEFVEVNGGQLGIESFGASGSLDFGQNQIVSPSIHGQTTAGLVDGRSGTAANFSLNKFSVDASEPSGAAACAEVYGSYERITGSCGGSPTDGLVLESASAHVHYDYQGGTLLNNGSSNTGWSN